MPSAEEQAAAAATAEMKRMSEATALLVPFIPVFKNDPLLKIDVKARDRWADRKLQSALQTVEGHDCDTQSA